MNSIDSSRVEIEYNNILGDECHTKSVSKAKTEIFKNLK